MSGSGEAQTFRDVIGRFATGVTIVTSHHAGRDHGMTASAVASLSLQPPMLLVCINRASPTGDAVRRSGTFVVNVLAEDQADLAHRFAMPSSDKFSGVDVTRTTLDPVTIAGALAHIECRVVEGVDAGTHTIFIGQVERAEGREGAPLAYFRGQYGQLHLARHDPAAAVLREHILSGELADRAMLDPDALAEQLGVSVGHINRVLGHLAGQGLVSGDPVRGYRVAPITGEAIADALDARCAIELGAAQLGVAAATPTELADLRSLAEQTVRVLATGPPVDVERYSRANAAFHEALVGLAASAALLDAYRGLALPGMLVRGLGPTPTIDVALAEDHREIVAAYEARDVAAALAAIIRHTERTKAAHAAAPAPGSRPAGSLPETRGTGTATVDRDPGRVGDEVAPRHVRGQ
ncbi:MAG TPA: flavin reductase [Euzebyales bacterium]|nr:flavin reductase [Euzebyales bacterium]